MIKLLTVIIEPAPTESLSLFDVAVSDVILENSPTLQRRDQSPIKSTIDKILDHHVSLRYGITKYRVIGYTITKIGYYPIIPFY